MNQKNINKLYNNISEALENYNNLLQQFEKNTLKTQILGNILIQELFEQSIGKDLIILKNKMDRILKAVNNE